MDDFLSLKSGVAEWRKSCVAELRENCEGSLGLDVSVARVQHV